MEPSKYAVRITINNERGSHYAVHQRSEAKRTAFLKMVELFEMDKMYTFKMTETSRPLYSGEYGYPGQEVVYDFEISEVQMQQLPHRVMQFSDYPKDALYKSAISEVKQRVKNWFYFKSLKAGNAIRRFKSFRR